MSNFLKELNDGVMLGDGAIGTLLYERGEPLSSCYDLLNLQKPQLVRDLHRDYLDAGSKLIETNTFGANRLKLEKAGFPESVREVNREGAKLAVELARPRGSFVAGSVGPLSANPSEIVDPASKEKFYREQMEGLLEGGVDVLFLETFSKVAEVAIALKVSKSLGTTPVIASLSFSDDGHTADGWRINEAFARLREAGAEAVGLNCHTGPMGSLKLLEELSVRPGDLVSVYPNAGRPQYFEGRYIYHPTPRYFADFAPKFVAQGVRLLGGCCGTTPETIRAMAKALDGLRPVVEKKSVVVIESRPAASAAVTAPETLLEVMKKRVLIVTELDPPKALSLEKMTEGSRALKKAGTDFVTLADNSLAILRVSNITTAHLLRDRTGLEPIIHLACRDRNLLGLQSELMGLNALGIHHVLALTGDPAKVGDHPGASSVYDVNSVGLIKTIKRMNEGFAANGRDLKGRTQFTIGCAFNPNAKNVDSQVRKLEDKVRAGANFVMTQPVFDLAQVKMTHEKTKHLGIPVLVGVMPLLNSRNAEFLHNEVPGIVIPDAIREKFRGKEGAEGNEVGLEVAREFCDEVLQYFGGIYLITPLMRFDLTVRLSEHVRSRGNVTLHPN